jgi:hypothetical protein
MHGRTQSGSFLRSATSASHPPNLWAGYGLVRGGAGTILRERGLI